MALKSKDSREMTKDELLQSLSKEDIFELLKKKGVTTDLSQPQPDDDGSVPEFVNISGKPQIITVTNGQDAHKLTVPRMGILRGSQWRDKFSKSTEIYPVAPFVERVKGPDGVYDDKYIMTEEQAIAHIKRIRNTKYMDRIRHFVDSQILVWDDAHPGTLKKMFDERLKMNVDVRGRDDRPRVIMAESEQLRMLEDRKRQMESDPYSTKAVNDATNKMYSR